MNEIEKKLSEKLDAMQEEYIRTLQECIHIPSVKGQAEEGAPYGRAVREALDFVLELGSKMGFQTRNVNNRTGYIEFGEGKEMVGVLGHLDVVPVDGEGWIYPPFSGEIVDGIMYGRGVADDKGPVIASVYALKAIAESGIPLNRRIRVMFGTDEESGSACVKNYIESGEEMPAIGFTPDGNFPLIFFEKGMSSYTLHSRVSKDTAEKILSLKGGIAANVVIPDCEIRLAGEADIPAAEGIEVIREDGTTLIKAKGKSAHGSMPELGINAGVRLMRALEKTDLGRSGNAFRDFILQKLGEDTNGSALGIHVLDEETGETTVNFGVMKYDGEEMTLTLDIRYPKNAVSGEVHAAVEKEAESFGLIPECTSHVECLYVSQESELVQKLMKVYRSMTGRDEKPMAIGGGTYAKSFPNMVAFGIEFPEDDNRIHSPGENITVDRLMQIAKIIAAAMAELAK